MGGIARAFRTWVRPLLTLVLAGSLIYIIMEPVARPRLRWRGPITGLSGQRRKTPSASCCAIGTLLWMHGWISGDVKGWESHVGCRARLDVPVAVEERHVSARHGFRLLVSGHGLAHVGPALQPIYYLTSPFCFASLMVAYCAGGWF